MWTGCARMYETSYRSLTPGSLTRRVEQPRHGTCLLRSVAHSLGFSFALIRAASLENLTAGPAAAVARGPPACDALRACAAQRPNGVCRVLRRGHCAAAIADATHRVAVHMQRTIRTLGDRRFPIRCAVVAALDRRIGPARFGSLRDGCAKWHSQQHDQGDSS